MKGEKRAVFGIILIALIIVSLTYIIAQSNLEGELNAAKPTKVNVTVKASTNPPIIIYVNNNTMTNELTNQIGVVGTGYPLNGGPATTVFNFTFTAYSDSGNQFLPGINIGDDVSVNVSANVSTGAKVRPVIRCLYRGVGPLYLGIPTKNYSCNFNVTYYDDPNPAIWTIRVAINTTSPNPIKSLVNGTQTFYLNKLWAWDTDNPNPSVNWTINQIATNTPTPVLSDNNISIINYGNVPITWSTGGAPYNRIKITPYTLLDSATHATYRFGASNFTAKQWDLTPCSETSFSDGIASILNIGVPVATGPTISANNLTFCAKTATNVPVTSYDAQSNQWQLDLESA